MRAKLTDDVLDAAERLRPCLTLLVGGQSGKWLRQCRVEILTLQHEHRYVRVVRDQPRPWLRFLQHEAVGRVVGLQCQPLQRSFERQPGIQKMGREGMHYPESHGVRRGRQLVQPGLQASRLRQRNLQMAAADDARQVGANIDGQPCLEGFRLQLHR